MTIDALTKLLDVCNALVETWDRFLESDDTLNPLDCGIGERIDAIRYALRDVNVGARR